MVTGDTTDTDITYTEYTQDVHISSEPEPTQNLPTLSPDLRYLLECGTHTARIARNLLEIINVHTGVTEAVLSLDANPDDTTLVQVTLPNGEKIWKDPALSDVQVDLAARGIVPYSPWIVDIIAEKIANGEKLTHICKQNGMPSYPVLCAWRRKHPSVDEKLEQARFDRAERYVDKAVEVAESATEDDVGSSSLKHNAYKWAAGVDNPKYSPKAKVEATITAPTQIIVHTGINREQGSTEVISEVGEDKEIIGGDR